VRKGPHKGESKQPEQLTPKKTAELTNTHTHTHTHIFIRHQRQQKKKKRKNSKIKHNKTAQLNTRPDTS